MRAKLILRWSRYPLIIAGVLLLGYVGYAVVDSKLYQASEKRRFQQAIAETKFLPGSSTNNAPVAASVTLPPAKDNRRPARPAGNDADSSRVGKIEISSIGMAAMIEEGTDDLTLQHAVGHVSGTALPGQNGNVAIAGHRDTFFRPLRNIRKGAEITLTTLKGTYRYRVDATEVVDPQDTDSLNESDDATLTLITCYPFYYVGSAPHRFIVRAHRSPG